MCLKLGLAGQDADACVAGGGRMLITVAVLTGCILRPIRTLQYAYGFLMIVLGGQDAGRGGGRRKDR